MFVFILGNVMGKSADRIISESTSIFKNKGFNATTVGDIATATGLLKGSLYTHFASKEEILLEVIATVELKFFEYIQIKNSKKIYEILIRTADFFIEEEACLMANLLSENLPASAQTKVLAFFESWKEFLINSMDKTINTHSKNIFAEDVISLFEGSVIMMKVVKNPTPVNRCLNQLIKKYDSLVLSTDLNNPLIKKQDYDYREVSDNGNDDTLVCDIYDSDNFVESSNNEKKPL